MVIGMRLAPPDPPLADEVVALRPLRLDDAPVVAALLDGDPEITRWLDQVPQPYGLREAREYVAACKRGWEEGTGASFAVVDPAEGRPIGSLGIRLADLPAGVAEARYWVAREARGRGAFHHNLRQGRRVDFVMYSLLPGELP
jgi:RimJ/RimL family protein N-acetyltransferase